MEFHPLTFKYLIRINYIEFINPINRGNFMPNCKKCGIEITEQQFKSLKGMCPKCSLLKYINKRVGSIVFLGTIGVLSAFLIYIAIRVYLT